MASKRLDETSTRIIRAVKAEAGREGVSGKELAIALGRDKKYIYERYRFQKPFDTADLDPIAHRLGISTDALLESAQFDKATRERIAA